MSTNSIGGASSSSDAPCRAEFSVPESLPLKWTETMPSAPSVDQLLVDVAEHTRGRLRCCGQDAAFADDAIQPLPEFGLGQGDAVLKEFVAEVKVQRDDRDALDLALFEVGGGVGDDGD